MAKGSSRGSGARGRSAGSSARASVLVRATNCVADAVVAIAFDIAHVVAAEHADRVAAALELDAAERHVAPTLRGIEAEAPE